MYILFFCYICYYSFIFDQVDQSTLTGILRHKVLYMHLIILFSHKTI